MHTKGGTLYRGSPTFRAVSGLSSPLFYQFKSADSVWAAECISVTEQFYLTCSQFTFRYSFTHNQMNCYAKCSVTQWKAEFQPFLSKFKKIQNCDLMLFEICLKWICKLMMIQLINDDTMLSLHRLHL